MKKNYFVGLVLIFFGEAKSQYGNGYSSPRSEYSSIQTQTIQIGEKVPNVLISNIINYKEGKGNLLGFAKGGLLIIDFWETFCIPCVRNLPYMDSLNSLYKGQVKILPVCKSKKDSIYKFLNSDIVLKKLKIPFATEDSVLNKLFLHRIIPHEVWIDKRGVVKAITSEKEVTIENINKVLEGKAIDSGEKVDDLNFDQFKPLFVNGNAGDGSQFLYRSLLTKFNSGLAGGTSVSRDANGKLRRILCYNYTPLQLFSTAFNEYKSSFINKTRMDIDISNSDSLFEWKKEKSYCYEMIVGEALLENIFFKYMLDDLNRYFEIKGSIERRKSKCWILVKTNEENFFELTNSSKLNSKPPSLSGFVDRLNRFNQIEMVLNESGYEGKINDQIFTCLNQSINDYPDINAIKKCINQYGLDLISAEREVEVLVIRIKK